MISAAEDDFANKRLNRPTVVGKFDGQVVEEFGVAGKLAGLPEVVGSANDAFAEEMFPDPVDHDAGGQWIFGVGDPLREFKSTGTVLCNVGSCAWLHRNGNEATRNLPALVADLAANADEVIGR